MDQHVITAMFLRCECKAEGTVPSAPSSSVPILLSLVLGLTVVGGCTGEEPHGGNPVSSHQPPNGQSLVVGRVSIAPNPVLRHRPISVSVEKDETHGPGVTYRYQWFVNGVGVYGATSSTFDPASLRRGDAVTVEVIASNGQRESAPYRTAPALVRNVPPTISRVVVEQDSSAVGSRLLATVAAADADQDDIRYVYRWLRNDSMVKEGPENVLETSGLARKDLVTVEVTPYDLDGAGSPARATPLVVGNNPPQILSQPSVVTNSGLYEYAVEAKDPDGDTVFFELEIAPPGMTIDRATGRLVWKMSPAISGTSHVKLIALDGQGARGWQEFDLTAPTQPAGESPSRN